MTERPDEELGPVTDDDPRTDEVEDALAAGDPAEVEADATDGGDDGSSGSTGGEGDDFDDDREPASPHEVAAVGEEFVAGMLAAMGLEAEVSSSVEGESAFVDVTGEGLGILIGRRGQTLDALQEVARTAVQRRVRSRIRLLVDVEGYRARRRKSLAEYATAMAERAKERGTEIELEPMTAYERKIVHDAVGEVEGASSFSEGVEPYRKVVVRGE
jgi:spoIIIJ-associated protein